MLEELRKVVEFKERGWSFIWTGRESLSFIPIWSIFWRRRAKLRGLRLFQYRATEHC